MINRITLVGRLTADPDLRYTPNGVAVTNFTLAVNRPFTNQHGERDADFLRVVVWRKQAENTATYLQKGHLCGVDGRLQSRSYDNQEGERRFITEIQADSVQFLEPKGKHTQYDKKTEYERERTPQGYDQPGDPFGPVPDDVEPF